MANIERRAKKKALTEEQVKVHQESAKQKLLLDQLQKVETLEEGKMKMRDKMKRSVKAKAKLDNEGRVADAKKASSQMLRMIHRESKQKADRKPAETKQKASGKQAESKVKTQRTRAEARQKAGRKSAQRWQAFTLFEGRHYAHFFG